LARSNHQPNKIDHADVSTPFVLIDAVPKKISLGDKIRNAVENVCMQKRVRPLDIERLPAFGR
jgi:hypothetical protein